MNAAMNLVMRIVARFGATAEGMRRIANENNDTM
jgi:hypothetical protein